MLKLECAVYFIHNNTGVVSNDFTIPPVTFGTIQNGIIGVKNSDPFENGTNVTKEQWNALVNSGRDVALLFNWVNEIEIDSFFKNQCDFAKITLPRNLNFDNINLSKIDINNPNPLINRGDRVIIQLTYSQPETSKGFRYKTVFEGYVSRVGITTPLVIECEDRMYALKQTRVQFPTQDDINKGKYRLTLQQLLQRILLGSQNPLIGQGQDNFQFNVAANTATHKNPNGKIPVIAPTNAGPFDYTTTIEKSVAEVFADLKKKLGVYIYFDDFGNLHCELPFINSSQIVNFTKFIYENQVIDDRNMKFQEEKDIRLKVVYNSPRSDKRKATLHANGPSKIEVGFVGDPLGDTITINGVPDMTQEDLNKYALQVLKANKYTGYAKGSSFETFGEPTVFVGGAVSMISKLYPEKNGNFEIVGIKRRFGINGYRQHIEIGPQLGVPNT